MSAAKIGVIWLLTFVLGLSSCLTANADFGPSGKSEYLKAVQTTLDQWKQLPEERSNLFLHLAAEQLSMQPELLFKLLKSGAEKGKPNCQAYVGGAYLYGIGVETNYGEAKKWLTKPAAKDVPKAQVWLGEMLLFGLGGVTNIPEAFRLFQKAAGKNDPEAQYYAGECSRHGLGTRTNIDQARKYYELSEAQNYAPAICKLAYLHEKGLGVDRNLDKALQLLKRASLLDYNPASCAVGDCYQYGFGVPQDSGEAVKWYRLAAEREFIPAQYAIGRAYLFGQGVERNLDRAKNWLRQAASGDDPAASGDLALALLYDANSTNNNEAVVHLEYAAKQGYVASQAILGCLLSHLIYTNFSATLPLNYDKAVQWLLPAAKSGHPMAEYGLGMMFADGHGVARDLTEAFKWLSLAKRQGISNADRDLENVQEAMTPKELVEGLRKLHAAAQAANQTNPAESRPGFSFTPGSAQ